MESLIYDSGTGHHLPSLFSRAVSTDCFSVSLLESFFNLSGYPPEAEAVLALTEAVLAPTEAVLAPTGAVPASGGFTIMFSLLSTPTYQRVGGVLSHY